MGKRTGKEIKMGIIGMGSMGKGLYYQSTITPDIKCVAVCDVKIDRAVNVLKWLGIDYKIAASQENVQEIIRSGCVAVCEDGQWLSCCDEIEVVIEASSSVLKGGDHAVNALEHDKHLVLVNSEVDLIFGPYLKLLAEKRNTVCTSADGDQYGVLKYLIDDALTWGLDLVMAGNIKGFLDRYANPTTITTEADKRNLDYRMCTSYTDGTKLNIEMAIVANAYGLSTLTPGMHGPEARHVKDVFTCFNFDDLWRTKKPFVDYILGAEPGGGVFVIGYCENAYQREMLAYYKMGPGPYYLFYRPYHLCHIEAMRTVVEAATAGQHLLIPDWGFETNVYAYAKTDLKAGTVLDGIGGYCCYGKIENLVDNQDKPGLPICLTDDVSVKRTVVKDEKIFIDDVVYNPLRSDFVLYSQARESSAIIQSSLNGSDR